MRVAALLRPTPLILLPVAVSGLCWLVPGDSEKLRGFDSRSSFGLPGIIFLASWYAACVVVVVVAFKCGRSTRPIAAIESVGSDPASLRAVLYVFSLVGAAGVVYSLYLASLETNIVSAITGGTANELSQSLGDGADLATFRYATAIAAPLAILLWQKGECGYLLITANVLLLTTNSLFASRLALFLAMTVYLFGLVGFYPNARVKPRVIFVSAVVAFALLALLNSSRNSNFYAAAGVSNPVESNYYQLLTYAGVPFQASTGVADALALGRYPAGARDDSGAAIVVPTFLQDKSVTDSQVISTDASPRGSERYGGQVSVARSLTTNSTFADAVSAYGIWSLLWVLMSFVAVGFAFGHFYNYSAPGSLLAGVLGYGLFETWRIYLFNQGIVVFLVMLLLLTSIVVGYVRRPSSRVNPNRAMGV